MQSKLMKPGERMSIGCWNVRTLNYDGAEELLINELLKFEWDIIGLSETHRTGYGDVRISDHSMLYSGNESEHHRGVGLLLSRRASNALVSHNFVNDRIISARFKTAVGVLICCSSVCANQ